LRNRYWHKPVRQGSDRSSLAPHPVHAISWANGRGHGLPQLSSGSDRFIHGHHVGQHRQKHQTDDKPEAPIFVSPFPRRAILGLRRIGVVVSVADTVFVIAHQLVPLAL
jgi:hypothetical protein